MRKLTIGTLALALTVGATTVWAQAPRGGEQRARFDRGHMNSSAASGLLRQSERLALSAEQTQQLQSLVQAQRSNARTAPAQQLRLRADLMEARSGNTNPTALRAVLDKISAAENDRIVASLVARQQALAVLTPEQREKMQSARADGRRGDRGAVRGGAVRGSGRGGAVRTPGRGDAVRRSAHGATSGARGARPATRRR